MSKVRIATRRSPLAIWQAEHVANRLRAAHPGLEVELVPMVTQGDKMLHAPLATIGGKGLFIKELERAMMDGRADVAVHSMKDVPVALPDGLHIPVILERADPRDAFVSRHYDCLDALPANARIGTSSLRRKCQLAGLRPDVSLVDLRGGVDTRLAKLDAGDFDAIILAGAGLERLGMHETITEYLATDRLLPAVGQGAMGIECRENDTRLAELAAPLNHEPTATRLAAERAMNRRLEGGCQVPIAGFAELQGDRLRLRGLVASLDGSRILRAESSGNAATAETLGVEVAERLLELGADSILEAVYSDA